MRPELVSAPLMVERPVTFMVPAVTTMLALLAAQFPVPTFLPVPPPVLLRRSPVQVPVAQLTAAAAGPVLLMAPRRVPLFVTVAELFESLLISSDALPIAVPSES